MTVEPSSSSSSDGPADLEERLSLDPIVAERLAPLADAMAPDLWAEAVRRASTEMVTGDDRPPSLALAASDHRTASTATATVEPLQAGDRRRLHGRTIRALAAAAAVVVVAGAATVAVVQGRREGQRIETPAAGFPPGVATGPALDLDHDAPVGAFAVLYPAGLVVVEADGDVVGHYTGQVPGVVYDPARGTVGRLMGAPEGCSWDGAGSDDALLFCHDANGPEIQGGGLGGISEILASFPAPAAGAAPVPGNITAAYPAEGTRTDGGAVLLQVQADCPSQQAFLVDDMRPTPATGKESTIRRIDGASASDTEPMAGLSRALGWSPDGSEAYVWRFNGACAPPLDRPGIYAYRLDGSSRLVVPTPPDAVDVQFVTGEPPTYGPGAITPLPPFPTTSTTTGPPTSDTSAVAVEPVDRPEGWAEWAGPLRPQRADDPALADDRSQAVEFARLELGMVDPEVLVTSIVDQPNWILTENGVSIRIDPYAPTFSSTAPAAVPEPWKQVAATTFWPDGIYSLSAKVDDDTGRWQATVNVPTHGAVLSASYTIGSEMLDPSTTIEDGFGGADLTFELSAKPTDVAVLTIRWHDANSGQLVGYQRTPLPPGRFAAG